MTRPSTVVIHDWGKVSASFVARQPAFEQFDRGAEVVAQGPEQVDVVQVLVAGEAVGQVIARIDVDEHFAAIRTQEAEPPVADFGWRTLASEAAIATAIGRSLRRRRRISAGPGRLFARNRCRQIRGGNRAE